VCMIGPLLLSHEDTSFMPKCRVTSSISIKNGQKNVVEVDGVDFEIDS